MEITADIGDRKRFDEASAAVHSIDPDLAIANQCGFEHFGLDRGPYICFAGCAFAAKRLSASTHYPQDWKGWSC